MPAKARTLGDHLILPLGAALAIGSAVLGAGLAKADPPGTAWSGAMGDHSTAAYWTDVTRMTDRGGDVNDVRHLADTICTTLRSGTSEGNLIASMSDDEQAKVGGSTMVVHGAEWHFCPEKY
jgi:hypothetical protein